MRELRAGNLMYDDADDDLKDKIYELCARVRRKRDPLEDSEWTLAGLLRDFGQVWQKKEDVRLPE